MIFPNSSSDKEISDAFLPGISVGAHVSGWLARDEVVGVRKESRGTPERPRSAASVTFSETLVPAVGSFRRR